MQSNIPAGHQELQWGSPGQVTIDMSGFEDTALSDEMPDPGSIKIDDQEAAGMLEESLETVLLDNASAGQAAEEAVDKIVSEDNIDVDDGAVEELTEELEDIAANMTADEKEDIAADLIAEIDLKSDISESSKENMIETVSAALDIDNKEKINQKAQKIKDEVSESLGCMLAARADVEQENMYSSMEDLAGMVDAVLDRLSAAGLKKERVAAGLVAGIGKRFNLSAGELTEVAGRIAERLGIEDVDGFTSSIEKVWVKGFVERVME